MSEAMVTRMYQENMSDRAPPAVHPLRVCAYSMYSRIISQSHPSDLFRQPTPDFQKTQAAREVAKAQFQRVKQQSPWLSIPIPFKQMHVQQVQARAAASSNLLDPEALHMTQAPW